jgi:membrane-bound lytic murein transglycosylase B
LFALEGAEFPALDCYAGIGTVTAMRKLSSFSFLHIPILLTLSSLSVPTAFAACQSPAAFGSWLQGFKKDAAAQGISPGVVSEALDGLTYDPSVIAKDRGQSVFAQSFLQFSGRMVSANRLSVGSSLLKKNAATFAWSNA